MQLKQRFQQFLVRAADTHGSAYDYSSVQYANTHTPIDIRCYKHGIFKQTPAMHLWGHGCPTCAKEDKPRVGYQVFIEKAQAIHNNKYDYSQIDDSNYFNIRSKLPIICPIHGLFYQRGDDHNRGHGCKKCSRISCSSKALTWLDYVAEKENIVIQHAGNGGEYRIPGSQMSADGYCAESNTIYEFDGDAFHGNPNRYQPDALCHPFDKTLTAEQLYSDTLHKHQRVRDMGYNLITIWESDYDQLNIVPTNRYSDLVVARFDQNYPQQLLAMGLEVVGEYRGSKHKHQLKCLKCGSIHEATPVSKTWSKKRHPDAYGCPECNRTLTNSKNKARGNYEQRLLDLGYKTTGYKNAGTKCLLTCVHCGKSKFVTPSAIIAYNKPCCKGES